MDNSMKWGISESLYGPNRLASSNAIKDVLLKDHVLQQGEWDAEAKRLEPWATTTSNYFKNPLPALNDSRRKVKSIGGRDDSTLILGTSSSYDLPTTSKDFGRKWLGTPKKAQPDLGTSIPDFATKYLSNNKVGGDGSIYTNSYNNTKKLDTSENTKERRQYTKDLRTTHFHLGNTRNNYDTETAHRFQPSKPSPDSSLSIASHAAFETHQSNVFRHGDWNVSGRLDLPYSVTRNDFHIKPFIMAGASSNKERVHRLLLTSRQESSKEESPKMPLGEMINNAISAKWTSQIEGPSSVTLHQAFAQYDTERSGCITKEQLQTMISEYGITRVSEEDINTLITQSNSRKLDGKVDYSVLARYIDSFSDSVSGEAKEKERPFQSIQQESYTGTHYIKTCYPPNTKTGHPKDDPSHPYYHISTHFQLGDNCDEQKSIYHKDYVVKDPWFKPLHALPPLSSQVLPETNDFIIQKSTKQADYIYHANEGRVIALAREEEMKRNQNRLAKQSIELAADPTTAQAHRQTSVFGTDFPSPPADFRSLTPRRAPLTRYRHMEANGALLVPPADNYTSEKQDKFTNQGSLTMLKEKKVECLARTGDNRSSHFILGADSEPKASEQNHQYFKKTHLDSSIPAAGKKQTADQNYSHVYPSESDERNWVSNQSTAKDSVSDIQERLKEINKMRFSIPRDPNSTDVRKAFLEFDPNLSGKISKEDFQKACSNMHIYIPGEEMKMMFDGCKADKEGKIDYFQFVKSFTEQLALTKGGKPVMSSVMKSDYLPPEERSSSQKRTINMVTKPLTTMDSHYFHYDHSKERANLTITAHDFSRPDRIAAERRGLSVF